MNIFTANNYYYYELLQKWNNFGLNCSHLEERREARQVFSVKTTTCLLAILLKDMEKHSIRTDWTTIKIPP